MENSEKGFIDYCKGYKLREIADKRGVELATVKTWSQRGINGIKWTALKALCTDDETGKVDLKKAAEFVSGKFNLSPAMAGNLHPPQAYPDKLKNNKALVSEVLKGVLVNVNDHIPESDDEVALCIDNYFNMCVEYGIIPTVEGLANSLHIAVNTLLDWEHNKCEKRGNSRTVRASLVKNAKQRIQDFDTKLAMMGEISPPVYIFRGKNYYGMRDEVETTVHHDNTNALQSKDEIQQRIMQGLPDDG